MVNGRVLIYGGKGALGSVCIDAFAAKDWWTCSVDLAGNDKASANVTVDPAQGLEGQANTIVSGVGKALDGKKLDAVLCVAGGWAGGNTAAEDFVKSCDLMIKQSMWTSIIAGKLSSLYLKEGGLLQLTGAQAALDYTPGMMGYGMVKAAVHQFTASLNSSRAGLPKKTTSLAILPITLDTPANRKSMPKADYSTWTSLEFVAEKLYDWASSDFESRPASGSLIELRTTGGQTDLVIGQLQQPSKMAQSY